jgi:hypothetical protein
MTILLATCVPLYMRHPAALGSVSEDTDPETPAERGELHYMYMVAILMANKL